MAMKTHYPAIALLIFFSKSPRLPAAGRRTLASGDYQKSLLSHIIGARGEGSVGIGRDALASLGFFVSFLLMANMRVGQNSPNLVFTDYDNTSKPFATTDSTFCKGQTIIVHGQNFKRATSGEAWDTTIVYLGGSRIWPNFIDYSYFYRFRSRYHICI